MKKLIHASLMLPIFLLVAGSLNGSSTPYGPVDRPGVPELTALVVAYEPELKGLLEAIEADPEASIDEVLEFKGVTYRVGSYKGRPVVIFATGISIANAAMTMQMAIDYFPLREVLYMGIAGAVNPELFPGDVIIPERWYYHDESVYANPDPENPGSFIRPDYYVNFLERLEERRLSDPNIPNYKPFRFIHPDEVSVIRSGDEKPVNMSYFAATRRLLEASEKALESLEPAQVVPQRAAVYRVGGNGVTGSVFLDNRDYREWTREVFIAEVTEMESAAVGQVCYINELDWVIIRAVSDLAGGQEGKNEENIYDLEVSRVGARVLFALLDVLILHD
ncbi:MAG: 5'-methylthioadenosine/S-adenosylhomocysteine nucleosidase [Puniceicoccaceae bacterium]